MSFNGWYKNSYPGVPSLYQYTLGVLQVNISLVEKTGVYNGQHLVGTPPVWVKYGTQPEMNAIWQAHFSTALPISGDVIKK